MEQKIYDRKYQVERDKENNNNNNTENMQRGHVRLSIKGESFRKKGSSRRIFKTLTLFICS